MPTLLQNVTTFRTVTYVYSNSLQSSIAAQNMLDFTLELWPVAESSWAVIRSHADSKQIPPSSQ